MLDIKIQERKLSTSYTREDLIKQFQKNGKFKFSILKGKLTATYVEGLLFGSPYSRFTEIVFEKNNETISSYQLRLSNIGKFALIYIAFFTLTTVVALLLARVGFLFSIFVIVLDVTVIWFIKTIYSSKTKRIIRDAEFFS